jgi:hypothetical protein
MKNFMGLSGFIWWQGVVEDNEDPLYLGRCRVRILGFHSSFEENTIQIEHLPWAHPIFPINGRESYKIPHKGDWVLGFFRDGRDAQEPVMFGVLPGIVSEELQTGQKYFGSIKPEKRYFEYVANNELLHDSVFTSNTNVWWRVDENIDSYSNNYIHWSNNSVTITSNTGVLTLESGKDLEANTTENIFEMGSNTGINIQSTNEIGINSNSSIMISANSNIDINAANSSMGLSAGQDVTATSSVNSYAIVATFDHLYSEIARLESLIAGKADAGHGHGD